MTESPPFLRRVSIRNYKSIAECDVELGKFTVIVGRNGSGKSNFLDAIRFVGDSLRESLEHAVNARGRTWELWRRGTTASSRLKIALSLTLSDTSIADYEIELEQLPRGAFRVSAESLQVRSLAGAIAEYRISDGELTRVQYPTDETALTTSTAVPEAFTAGRFDHMPKPAPDRLYLVGIAGLEAFREAYDGLLSMGFYNFQPEEMRGVQQADSSDRLLRSGRNLAAVIGRMEDDRPDLIERVGEYLQCVVPDIISFDCHYSGKVGQLVELLFTLGSSEMSPLNLLSASAMSDGTLRALGSLVAAMQIDRSGHRLPLVGIEEPETALHPAASAALLDALREASLATQLLVTTHSPDLLEDFDPATDTLIVAQQMAGNTEIGPLDEASASSIRDHLFTAGELLRMDQLQPRAVLAGHDRLSPTSGDANAGGDLGSMP
jgi:predicted ATPase